MRKNVTLTLGTQNHSEREWDRHLILEGGWRIFVRPVTSEDEPLIFGFLEKISPEDRRLRFFGAVKEFTHAFTTKLTQLDYTRAMAFAAFDVASNQLIGVVRLHSNALHDSGEYAILSRSDLKGRGLGWALMQLIIEYAKSERLQRISGQVLQDNVGMLTMCRELGFDVKASDGNPGIYDVTLTLTTG